MSPKVPPSIAGGGASSEADDAPSVDRHHREAPRALTVAVVTVSDTRSAATDSGGDLLAEGLAGAGHEIGARCLVPDERGAIRNAVETLLENKAIQAVLLTGGSGLAPRDVTPEALEGLIEREIPGFGELFRMLSYEEIGAAAMLSRAFAGIARQRIVIVLPGSRGALRLALDKLLLPELRHLVGEACKDQEPS